MKPKNFALLMLVMALMAIPSLVLADTYVQVANHQDGFQAGGQNMPGRDDTTATWMGDNIAVHLDGTSSTIVNGETGMVTMVDHEKKSYVEMPIEAMGNIDKMLEASGKSEEEVAMMKQQMQAMMAMMKLDAKVTPTEETKEIRGWNCKKYLVDLNMGMAKVKQEVWTTTDVKLDYSMYDKVMASGMMQMPGFQDALKEMEKMDGLQVQVEGTVSAMGQEFGTKTEVLVVETKDAPAGTYDVPKDYKKEAFEMGMGMGMK